MKEAKYNLIDEPWIKAIDLGGKQNVYNLKEIFANANNIAFLAGETDLQNNAILRLLIAISVTCLYRYEINGNEKNLTGRDEALERFKSFWDNGFFPERYIGRYLEQWYDRFYLIGGERPFYQVENKYVRETEEVKNKKNPLGKVYTISPYGSSDKLSWVFVKSINGEILESGNSSSPFANKAMDGKEKLLYDEAARWLLYYMSYADCSSKIPGKWNAGMTFTSSGANIHPIGRNLFETILLCSVLLDSNQALCGNPKPAWENDYYTVINDSPYGESFPDNLPELYTQQSRKVIIPDDGGYITGIYTAAGDRYGNINADIEPMFAFHIDKNDKSGATRRPNHLKINSTGWKEFNNVFGESNRDPSRWINLLFNEDIIEDDLNIPYVMTDLGYGSMQCGVDYAVSTGISVNRKFFEDSYELECAKKEVDRIRLISSYINIFGQEIDQIYGAKSDKKGIVKSAIADRIVQRYEQKSGEVFECYLLCRITLQELQKAEIKHAEECVEHVLDELNIAAVYGHGDHSIGKAENGFERRMWSVKKELGLVSSSVRR